MPTELPPTPASFWLEGDREADFFEAHFDEFRQQYPDQFIAVDPSTESLISIRADLNALAQDLARRGFDVRRVWIIFQPSAPRDLIL